MRTPLAAIAALVAVTAGSPALTVTSAAVTNNSTVTVAGTGFATGTLVLTIAAQRLTNVVSSGDGTSLTGTLPGGLAAGTYTLTVTRTEYPDSVCISPSPGPDWICLNGGWLPPDHPLVKDAAIVSTAGVSITLTATSASLSIRSATYDAATGDLRIYGQAFGTSPAVTVDGVMVTVGAASDTQIAAVAPGLATGTYRIVVSDGGGAHSSDPFELAVGITGPQGAKGDTGATGATGAQGVPAPTVLDNGWAGQPALTFAGDSGTGVYAPAYGTVGLAATAARVLSVGSGTVACGYGSGASSMGSFNTAVGRYALASNSKAIGNSALGSQALAANHDWGRNTAAGYQALTRNTDMEPHAGYDNTAGGYQALAANTYGYYNTAAGAMALASNSTGNEATAIGYAALKSAILNAAGINTAIGAFALSDNTQGGTGIGYAALSGDGASDTAVGWRSMPHSIGVALGASAGSQATGGYRNVFIANEGQPDDSEVIRIGTQGTQQATYIAGISGVTTAGVPMVIDANGQLGTIVSSRRFKQDIADIGDVNGLLRALRPVTFRYIQPAADGTRPLQFGLIAEDVAAVDAHLVQYGADGQVNTVLYQMLPPLLLAGYQQQHRTLDAASAELRRDRRTFAAEQQAIGDLQARLARLEALLHAAGTR